MIQRAQSARPVVRVMHFHHGDTGGMSGTALQKDLSVQEEIPDGARHPLTQPQIQIGLLTGGQDPHYTHGLAMGLVAEHVGLEVIGSDAVETPAMRCTPGLRFLNLYGRQQEASVTEKLRRVFMAYVRLIRWAAHAEPKLLHILWNNKFPVFDRTLLMLYYRLLNKKVVFTAHNVNAGRRDSKDSLLNLLTLKMQYRLAHHIFVHTDKMKSELVERFGVGSAAVTVIPYGLNNAVPSSNLTREEARRQLGLLDEEKTILFFGAIKPYKGLEYLTAAFEQLAGTRKDLQINHCRRAQEWMRRVPSADPGEGEPRPHREPGPSEDRFHPGRRDRGVFQGGRCGGPAVHGDFSERYSFPCLHLWSSGDRNGCRVISRRRRRGKNGPGVHAARLRRFGADAAGLFRRGSLRRAGAAPTGDPRVCSRSPFLGRGSTNDAQCLCETARPLNLVCRRG